jgi:hypothetical protein
MARESGFRDPTAETLLAQAKFLKGTLAHPREEAERLSTEKDRSELQLAILWEAIGDENRLLSHARIAFQQACADGEPYVCRYDLEHAQALIKRLSGKEPECETHNPSHEQKSLGPGIMEPDVWLREVKLIVERLRIENKDAIERHNLRTPEERRIIRKRNDLRWTIKGKDSRNGRPACWFVQVDPQHEREFSRIIKHGNLCLSDYGEILESCYGEEPTEEIKNRLREKYGWYV